MVTRTAFTQLHYSVLLLALVVIVMAIVFVAPLVAPATLEAHERDGAHGKEHAAADAQQDIAIKKMCHLLAQTGKIAGQHGDGSSDEDEKDRNGQRGPGDREQLDGR